MDYCLEYRHLTDEEHIFRSIEYEELIHLLDSFQSGLVFIGGPWCKNCQAVVKELNEIGKKSGLEVIYNYDSRFINIFNEEEDLRDCKTLEHKLKYYAIVEKIGYKSEEFVVDTLIPRIHIPFIFGVKNGHCIGYYSPEFVKDVNGLHIEGDTEDKTIEFICTVTDLIHKIKNERML